MHGTCRSLRKWTRKATLVVAQHGEACMHLLDTRALCADCIDVDQSPQALQLAPAAAKRSDRSPPSAQAAGCELNCWHVRTSHGSASVPVKLLPLPVPPPLSLPLPPALPPVTPHSLHCAGLVHAWLQVQASRMVQWELDVPLPAVPPTHIEENYRSLYAVGAGGTHGNDLALRLHPNGLCVITLAPSHAALAASRGGGAISGEQQAAAKATGQQAGDQQPEAQQAAAATAAEAGVSAEGQQSGAAGTTAEQQQHQQQQQPQQQRSGPKAAAARLELAPKLLQAQFRRGRGPLLQAETVLGRQAPWLGFRRCVAVPYRPKCASLAALNRAAAAHSRCLAYPACTRPPHTAHLLHHCLLAALAADCFRPPRPLSTWQASHYVPAARPPLSCCPTLASCRLTAGGAAYVLRCCCRGLLVELNSRLEGLQGPELLRCGTGRRQGRPCWTRSVIPPCRCGRLSLRALCSAAAWPPGPACWRLAWHSACVHLTANVETSHVAQLPCCAFPASISCRALRESYLAIVEPRAVDVAQLAASCLSEELYRQQRGLGSTGGAVDAAMAAPGGDAAAAAELAVPTPGDAASALAAAEATGDAAAAATAAQAVAASANPLPAGLAG